MMKSVLLTAVLLAAAGTAQANPAEELMKKYACVACHAVDNQLVGPAYKKVAEKYRGDKKAEAGAAGYSCPMHPDITSDKPGTCSKCGMELEQKK